MNKRTIYLVVLAATVLLFLIKGIGYALVGRYWPLSLALVTTLLLSFGLNNDQRKRFWIIRFWAGVLILWATLRIILGLSLLVFPNGMTENHVYEQFGSWGGFLSIMFFTAGIFLWRSIHELANNT
ncbi:MAG: hypothetical protein AAGA31_17060 [Bacteroidota bacterium]